MEVLIWYLLGIVGMLLHYNLQLCKKYKTLTWADVVLVMVYASFGLVTLVAALILHFDESKLKKWLETKIL